jgi:HlyD family secretion protein
MRKVIYPIIAALLIIVIVTVIKNNNLEYIPYNTYEAKIDTVRYVEKLSGTLSPLSEIAIKSRISGILDTYFIEVGQVVKAGAPIARVKIIPDPNTIEQAEKQVQLAQLNLDLEQKNYERAKELFEKDVTATTDFETVENSYKIRQEELKSAIEFLDIAKKGFSKKNVSISDIITATSGGTIVEIPLNVGASIIERNNFNEGTTLAVIANLDRYLFQSSVNEMIVSKLKIGKSFQVIVNALSDHKYNAILTKINPKGEKTDGIVRFRIEATLQPDNEINKLKPGFTAIANLEIETDSENVVVFEKDLIYETDSIFVNLLTQEDKVEKTVIKTGISNGIKTAIVEGVNVGDRIVVQ